MFFADEDYGVSALFADVVDECELFGGDVEALRDRFPCYSLRVCSGDSFDQY